MDAHLSGPFVTRRMKLLRRPEKFMRYGKMEVDVEFASEFLYPSMKLRLRLITAKASFDMISDKPQRKYRSCSSFALYSLFRSQGRYSQEKMGHSCKCFHGVQLFRDFGKDFSHHCQTKPIFSRKRF